MRAARLAAALLLLAAPRAEAGIVWFEDFGAAVEQSEKQNLPLLVEFYTSWCQFCGKLEKETFGDPRVVELAGGFVCVRVDAEVQRGVAHRYQAEGFPLVVLAAPGGRELLRVAGFRDAEGFSRVLQAIRDQGGRMAEVLVRIEQDPRDFAAREELGGIYLDLGLGDLAEAHLRAALKLAPRSPPPAGGESDEARIQFLLGRALLAAGDHGGAARILEKLLVADPSGPRAADCYLQLARAYAGWGKWKKASEVAAELERSFPGSPQAETARGLIE